ncbi:MAG TPA: phenylacetic acid degradation protein PaaN, partial [Nocardioidaceae bacterium]
MSPSSDTSTDYFSAHRAMLDDAVEATRTRAYYSAFPESPSPRVYGEKAAEEGAQAFEGWLDGDFSISVP